MNKRSERISNAIKESGMSYSELAASTGISKSSLQRYATGETEKISVDAIEKIAHATNTDAKYLMGWENSDTNNKAHDASKKLEGIYFRLGKEAQELGLDEEDIETILNLYRKHRKKNNQ